MNEFVSGPLSVVSCNYLTIDEWDKQLTTDDPQ
jgi:hypothetical protein